MLFARLKVDVAIEEVPPPTFSVAALSDEMLAAVE
jgi:hypothetical protein